MAAFESLLNGMFFALGTLIISSVGGFVIFRYTKSWLTRTIAEIWANIKAEGLRLDGIKIDGHLETKKARKKKKLK